MSVAIKCLLEEDVPGVPHMEGKSLAMAYCSDATDDGTGESAPNDKIISIDFGGNKPKGPAPSNSPPAEPLFAPIDGFIATAGSLRWHDAAKGVAAVRRILKKLRDGATVEMSPDFEFVMEGSEELTEEVRFELEELEQTLVAAQKARTRFCLVFDI